MFVSSMKQHGRFVMGIVDNTPGTNCGQTDNERVRIVEVTGKDQGTKGVKSKEKDTKGLDKDESQVPSKSSKPNPGKVNTQAQFSNKEGLSSCQETGAKDLTGGEVRESCIVGYLRYFQSMLCARSLPCDDGELPNTGTPPLRLYQSWRRKVSAKPKEEPQTVAVAEQKPETTDINTPVREDQQNLDRGDTDTTPVIESTANLNAWSQIYYDITRYNPQMHTRLILPRPEIVVVSPTSVHTDLMFRDSMAQDIAYFNNIGHEDQRPTKKSKTKKDPETKPSASQEKSKHRKKSKVSKVLQDEGNNSNKRDQRQNKNVEDRKTSNRNPNERDGRVSNKHRNGQHALHNARQGQDQPKVYVYKQIYDENKNKNDKSMGHHTKLSKKHLNNLGSNMLCLVNQAKHQAQGFFGNKKMKIVDNSQQDLYMDDNPSVRITHLAEWYSKYCRDLRQKQSFHLEIKPRNKKIQKDKFQRHCDRQILDRIQHEENIAKHEANFERLRRKIKKKHIELETLRKSIQKEAKGVCCELKKFREDEKQHTKELKLKDKQENNGSKYVKGVEKDQEHDKTEMSMEVAENYKDLLQKYLLVEEECKLFNGIYQELQEQKPRIQELRNKSTHLGSNCVNEKQNERVTLTVS